METVAASHWRIRWRITRKWMNIVTMCVMGRK